MEMARRAACGTRRPPGGRRWQRAWDAATAMRPSLWPAASLPQLRGSHPPEEPRAPARSGDEHGLAVLGHRCLRPSASQVAKRSATTHEAAPQPLATPHRQLRLQAALLVPLLDLGTESQRRLTAEAAKRELSSSGRLPRTPIGTEKPHPTWTRGALWACLCQSCPAGHGAPTAGEGRQATPKTTHAAAPWQTAAPAAPTADNRRGPPLPSRRGLQRGCQTTIWAALCSRPGWRRRQLVARCAGRRFELCSGQAGPTLRKLVAPSPSVDVIPEPTTAGCATTLEPGLGAAPWQTRQQQSSQASRAIRSPRAEAPVETQRDVAVPAVLSLSNSGALHWLPGASAAMLDASGPYLTGGEGPAADTLLCRHQDICNGTKTPAKPATTVSSGECGPAQRADWMWGGSAIALGFCLWAG